MKTLFTILAIFLSVQAISQERVNRVKLTFGKESKQLKSATGWSYNETSGEWVDYSNVLCPDSKYKTDFKMLQGDYMHSHYSQSFKSIQTKTVTVDSVEYYVLIVNNLIVFNNFTKKIETGSFCQ